MPRDPAPTSDPGPILVLHTASHHIEIDDRWCAVPDRAWAMLMALSSGRVMSRAALTRAAGLEGQSPRRCESLLVELRRLVGNDRILNLRRRGWMLTVPVELRAD